MAAEDIGGALDLTVASLKEGVVRLGAEAALPAIMAWQERLPGPPPPRPAGGARGPGGGEGGRGGARRGGRAAGDRGLAREARGLRRPGFGGRGRDAGGARGAVGFLRLRSRKRRRALDVARGSGGEGCRRRDRETGGRQALAARRPARLGGQRADRRVDQGLGAGEQACKSTSRARPSRRPRTKCSPGSRTWRTSRSTCRP